MLGSLLAFFDVGSAALIDTEPLSRRIFYREINQLHQAYTDRYGQLLIQ